MNPVVWLVGDPIQTDITNLEKVDANKGAMWRRSGMHAQVGESVVGEVGGNWSTLMSIACFMGRRAEECGSRLIRGHRSNLMTS